MKGICKKRYSLEKKTEIVKGMREERRSYSIFMQSEQLFLLYFLMIVEI